MGKGKHLVAFTIAVLMLIATFAQAGRLCPQGKSPMFNRCRPAPVYVAPPVYAVRTPVYQPCYRPTPYYRPWSSPGYGYHRGYGYGSGGWYGDGGYVTIGGGYHGSGWSIGGSVGYRW